MLKSEKAMTLIELLVAISVVAILAVTAFTYIDPLEQFRKVRDAQRLFDLRNLEMTIEAYLVFKGEIPGLDSPYRASTASSQSTDTASGGWLIAGREVGEEFLGFDLLKILRSDIPLDPNLGGVAIGTDSEGKERLLHFVYKTDGEGRFSLGALKEAGSEFEIIEMGTAFNLITPSDFPEN